MSLERGFSWDYKGLEFKGYSIAGQTTSLLFNNPKICFDIAQGLPFNLSAKLYCLTHLHADHGAGLNYLLSQRSLFRLPHVPILMPQSVVDPVHRILKAWQEIEGFKYNFEILGVGEGFNYDFSPKYIVKAFPTTHRVESFGYLVYEKKKKLKKDFQDLSREELLNAKSQGQKLEEHFAEPLMAFTGDTQIEFLKSHPDVAKARILFMECTYIDEKKTVKDARNWGHIHLDEIIENLALFENEHVSLIHLSSRYNTNYAQKVLSEKLPKELQSRFSWFPRPL